MNYRVAMRIECFYCIASFIGLVVSGGSALRAQQANLSGRIFDSSQLAVPDAIVAVTGLETHLKRFTQSNDSGLYSLPGLPPGKYDITVKATGFDSQERKGILIEVAQQAQIDFTLGPGTTSQVVTVSSGTDLLQTSDASVSTMVER